MNRLLWLVLMAGCCVGGTAAFAQGSPVTISGQFFNLENDGPTNTLLGSGQFFRIGATTVTPNGNDVPPTTGSATTFNLVTGEPYTTSLIFDPAPDLPGFYERYFSYNNANLPLLGPWTLTFTNGSMSSSTVVTLPAGQQMAPLIQTATITGTSQNPTFSWTPPPGATVDGYRVNLYQDNLMSPNDSGQIYSANFSPSVTSFTVPTALNDGRYATTLTPGVNYTLSVDILETRDGSTTNLTNANVDAISRTYFNFTPQSTTEAVYLPQVVNGVFSYDIPVVPGKTYTIDPSFASGYKFAAGVGGPNFASVDLPAVQSNAFSLSFASGGKTITDSLLPNTIFFFPTGGVSAFTVTGIDKGDQIALGNTTAFDTSVTFVGGGVFSGTQTPIPFASAVPEPPTYAAMLAGLLLLAFGGRRRLRGLRGLFAPAGGQCLPPTPFTQ